MRQSVRRMGKVAVAFAVGCVLVAANAAMADATLSPEVKAILEKSVTAQGGADAIKKVESRIVKAKIEVVGAGLSLDVTSYQKAPGLMAVYVVSAQAGDQTKGTDGVHAWMIDAAGGPRLLDGAEKSEMIREANIQSDLNPEKEYAKVELGGNDTVDGKAVVKLNCVSPDGKKSTLFYDKESGLMVRRDSTESTQMGDMQVSATMSDYRDAGGVKMPFASTVKFGPGTLQITTEKVDTNVEVPADKLAVPAEIAKLIEAEKAAPPAPTMAPPAPAMPSMPAMPAVPAVPAAPAMPK